MSRLPFLLSVPHAGLRIPDEVADHCLLDPQDVRADADDGATEIFASLGDEVTGVVATDIARSIVDPDRAPDDRGEDGVVKERTRWRVPVYREPLPEETVEVLLERHYRPYFRRLEELAPGARLGIDCHTMAEFGPPLSQDPGRDRPRICLGTQGGTCPPGWVAVLVTRLARCFGYGVAVNSPFVGGHIVRSRPGGLPWVQLQLVRTPWLSLEEKRHSMLTALRMFCQEMERRGAFLVSA